MNKIKLGLTLGVVAGIIDVLPMLAQKLTWDANLSALSFWIIAGFFISTSNIKIKSASKGLLISLLLMIPTAFIVGWQQPIALVPMVIMNIILGSSLGVLIEKYGK